MRIWDEQKMADLVAEKSRLDGELAATSTALLDMKNSDKPWDTARNEEYGRSQLYHAQLTREIGVVQNNISGLELFRPKNVKAKQDSALTRYLKGGEKGLEDSEVQEFMGEDDGTGFGRPFTIRPEAATRSDDSSGQELVPETVTPNVVDRLAYFGGVARMAQTFFTATGNDFRFPQHDGASEEGEILGAQATAVADTDIADFLVESFTARTCSSRRIFITREMLQDSVIDVEGFAMRRAIRRMGRSWDRAFTLGTTTPRGVVDSALPGITAAATAAITYEEMVDMIYAVNRAYREGGEMGEGGLTPEGGGRIGFLMSEAMEKILRKMKDGDGRPLWWPANVSSLGSPNAMGTILDYPYEVSGVMAAPAAGTVPLLFGNFSYYGMRMVRAIEMFRFQDSETMKNNSIAILGFSRRDGKPIGVVRPATGGDAAQRNKCEAIAKLTMAAS